MALRSKLFQGDRQLEAAAVSDAAHILTGASGEHVSKIQTALNLLDDANLQVDGKYGPGTAAAVRSYKSKRNIINRAIQTQADSIAGKLTIARMDEELANRTPAPPPNRPSLLLNFKFDEPLLIDIIVKLLGFGSPGKQGLHDPVESAAVSFNTMADPRYDKSKRFCTAFVFTGSLDSRNPSQVIIDAIKLLDKSAEGTIDRVYIWGGSAGGKNALTVANGIASTVGSAMQFVALADAAFDENDPMMTNPGDMRAKVRKNWFQTFGQTIDPRREFHGPVAGFESFDLTNDPGIQATKKNFESLNAVDRLKGAERAKAADSAHNAAFGIGQTLGLDDIRTMIQKPKV